MKLPILAFLLITAPHCLRSAQMPETSWDSLRQLRPGEKIEILDAKMKSHCGDFASYTEEGLSLRQDGREVSVPRAEVASQAARRIAPQAERPGQAGDWCRRRPLGRCHSRQDLS